MLPPKQVQLGLIFSFSVFCICGCKDRTNDIVGVWDWGTYAVHFDTDKSWGATDKKRSTYERMGGSWSLSGNKLKLEYAGSDAPSPTGSVFSLSEDGITLDAETGGVGTMKKRLAPASLDVK